MEPFLSLVERLHTKRVIYFGLAIGVFALSLMFSYRAAVVYYEVFLPLTGWLLADLFAVVVFIGIAVGEMVSAIHWVEKKKPRNIIIIIIVVLHDGGGVFYTLFGQNGFKLDIVRIVVFLGMTIVSGLPFLFGYRMHEIAPQIQDEIKEGHKEWIDRFAFRMERRGAMLVEKNARKDKKLLERFAPPSILATIAAARGEAPRQVSAPRPMSLRTQVREEPIEVVDADEVEAEQEAVLPPFQSWSHGNR